MATDDVHREVLGTTVPRGQVHRAYPDDFTRVCGENSPRKVTDLLNGGQLVAHGFDAIMAALTAAAVEPDKLCRRCFGAWVRTPYRHQWQARHAEPPPAELVDEPAAPPPLAVANFQSLGTSTVAVLSDGGYLAASNGRTSGPVPQTMTDVSWLNLSAGTRTHLWSRRGTSHVLALEEAVAMLNDGRLPRRKS